MEFQIPHHAILSGTRQSEVQFELFDWDRLLWQLPYIAYRLSRYIIDLHTSLHYSLYHVIDLNFLRNMCAIFNCLFYTGTYSNCI